MLDVREMVRRFRLGEKDRQIARDLRASRRTVGRYREWAAKEGLLAGELPGADVMEALLRRQEAPVVVPRQVSSVEPFRAVVEALRGKGVEVKTIHERLAREHGFGGSYAAVLRFVRRLWPELPKAVVRIEVAPGEEAQVDFGYAGEVLDATGRRRRAWVFVMTLSHSRHQYAEVVLDQSVGTWLRLHVNAFEFFGGAPRRVVLDNLKAAIVRASVHDPVVQRAYRELAEHYGFVVSPCRPRTPEHKGKIESGVRYVKRSFFAGHEPRDLATVNRELLRWVEETAGRRIHGTTRVAPLERFGAAERAALLPLPAERYDCATWKCVTLHRDGHVVFEKAYYSAPHRLIGEKLVVRGGAREVRIFREHELVATHTRAHAGERRTHRNHLPPEKLPGLELCAERLRAEADEHGGQTAELVTRLLDERPVDRRRAARAVLQLGKRFGAPRLEAACRRALLCEEASYRTVKRILEQGLERTPLPPEVVDSSQPLPPEPPREPRYARCHFAPRAEVRA